MLRVSMVAIVITVLVGCSTAKRPMPEPVFPAPDPIAEQRPSDALPPSTRPTYNLAGYPKAAQEGYVDGCETAKQSAYGFKDKKRYAVDMQYRMGWDDGLSICRGNR
ncbi:hypothetical protein Nstercoris_01107 [Nitrosomonas stercoris]|uniref:Lipoprotein n=1 Tax=Nitrosomonas stercoris TaxID=1444684 RepID=A0A4Y1YPB8_9PROT|nr:hypothetical protein Nstercoris_01107 [Nitrosomonas stercoris]